MIFNKNFMYKRMRAGELFINYVCDEFVFCKVYKNTVNQNEAEIDFIATIKTHLEKYVWNTNKSIKIKATFVEDGSTQIIELSTALQCFKDFEVNIVEAKRKLLQGKILKGKYTNYELIQENGNKTKDCANVNKYSECRYAFCDIATCIACREK